MKNKKFSFYLLVSATTMLFVLILNKVKTQTYIPITNHHSGISINILGAMGEEYIFDRYYFDPLINDCGLCYIKSDIDIELSHNANNSRIDGSSTIITGGDFGEIRYRVDQDWRTGLYWAGDDGPYANTRPLYPEYTAPLSFDDMEFEPGIPVVGTSGFLPGVEISNKGANYCRGLIDKAGNEYHYFTYADDDDLEPNWKNLEMSASDGKSMLFCVNPKTPAIWLSAAVSGAQYYTTPGKIYWVPKFHEQISYVEEDVDINLKNIMNSNTVYYRIDGGSYTAYSGAISSNTLSDGEHLLEFYYDPAYIQTRTIVKNPEHPCENDVFEDGSGHGYLLWRDDAEFLRTQNRILNGCWVSEYASYKSEFLSDFSYQGNGGIRNNDAPQVLMYAIVGVMEGVSQHVEYMDASKTRLLSTRRMHIENIGYEVLWSADPNPCHELTYRGYYDDWEIWNYAFAYDLLAKYYRSDQFPGGITPIEDLRIRDMLAQSIHEGLMSMGGFSNDAPPYVDISPESGMWTTALQEASVAAALAMPSYNTHYYGTSGFDGTQAIHPWAPYPDYPESWKDVYLCIWDRDNPSHVERLHPFPNRRTFFDWYNGTIDDGLIRADGNWHDKSGYGGPLQMGHGMEFFYNIMKRKFGISYPNLDLYMQKSAQAAVYCYKDGATAGYPRRNMANEYFPDLAPFVEDYDPAGKYFYTIKPYHFFFHNPDWASVALCGSSDPPSVPTDFTGTPNETDIQLRWSPSTHSTCIVDGYIIKRDGNILAELGRIQGTQYIDTGLVRGTQYEYTIAAVSEGGAISGYCPPIQVETLVDNSPPEITNSIDTDIPTLIIIEFDEELDANEATKTSNYVINNGVSVYSIDLQPDAKKVYVNVSPLQVNSEYILTLNNIADIRGNVVAENTNVSFHCLQGSDNFALNRPVLVDSEYGAGFFGENAVDGDNVSGTSRWMSDDSSYPHWIEVDLLQTVSVDQVKYWVGYDGYNHPIYDYQIQSWDGSNWVDIISVNNNGSSVVEHTFEPVSTRKIRLFCNSGSDNIVRLYEFEIYGEISSGENVAVTDVSLSESSISLESGDTWALSAIITPSHATNKNVDWATDNASVAIVDASGLITAVSEGNAKITVTTNDGGFAAECDVEVVETLTGMNVALGKPVTVDSEYSSSYPAANAVDGEKTDDQYRWLSANAPYPHWIEVDLQQTYSITEANFWTGYNYQYDFPVRDYKIQYWSGSSWVDIVNVSGNANPVVSNSFPGIEANKVRLYCTDGYDNIVRLYELEIIGTPVTIPVSGISISPQSLNLDIGQTANLTESIIPVDATVQTVSWSSSNSYVARVDSFGIVTAVSEGIVTITVTSDDGGYTAHCEITIVDPYSGGPYGYTYLCDEGQTAVVSGTMNIAYGANGAFNYLYYQTADIGCSNEVFGDPIHGVEKKCYVQEVIGYVAVDGVTVSPYSLILNVGQTAELTENIFPENATDQDATWSTDDSSIATIDENGLLEAISTGSAAITVTTHDGGYTAICNVTVNELQDGVNVAIGKPAIADSEYLPSFGAINAVDGNNIEDAHRWVSADVPYPHWIEVDLQQTYTISEMRFWTGYNSEYRFPIHDYKLQYWDGSNWIDIISVTGNLNPAVEHAFTSVETNKIRLYCLSGSDNIVRLYELEVIGTAGNNLKGLDSKHDKYGLNISPTIHLFPNPVANNAINLEMDGFPRNMQLLLQVVDMSGRMIYINKVEVNSAKQLFTYSVPEIITGAYILTVTSDRVHFNKKFFVK